jgi:oligoribonuclease NrnB/cAMP/cGMP phosphodiesterase (DHH superfamily)
MPAARPPLCIFHRNCLDGRGAAAVVRRRFPGAACLPMQYGDPRPEAALLTDRPLFVVDFGFEVDGMRYLRAQAATITWLDHHASQVPVQRALGWGVVDVAECGATLAWRELCGDRPPPPVLPYIKDKDHWRWQLPRSRAIAAGLSAAFGDADFAGILDADLDAMAAAGEPLVAAQQARVAALAATGIALTDAYGLPGLRTFAVLAMADQNELGEHICLPRQAGGLGFDLAVLYYYKKKARRWVHSLRSPSVDCAAIAARFGGGGHPQSACYLAEQPLVPAVARSG